MSGLAAVRVTRPIISHLEGSDAWQSPQEGYNTRLEVGLMDKIKAAKPRRDGSVTVTLTAVERGLLYGYVDAQAVGAKDNIVSPRDLRLWPALAETNTVGEYNACRALLRKLHKLGLE